jgi:DNA-binding response OmpR family regulator
VCVLDLMLPGIDGWRVIEQARAEGIGTPIVVVSARGTEHDRAELTPTEFRLIYTLAREQSRVLTRDELLQRVWGRRATHRDRTVDVFVRKLREKIDRRAPAHAFIHTPYGVGYKLEAEPK